MTSLCASKWLSSILSQSTIILFLNASIWVLFLKFNVRFCFIPYTNVALNLSVLGYKPSEATKTQGEVSLSKSELKRHLSQKNLEHKKTLYEVHKGLKKIRSYLLPFSSFFAVFFVTLVTIIYTFSTIFFSFSIIFSKLSFCCFNILFHGYNKI